MEDCGSNIAPRHPTSDAVIAGNAGPTANETITNPAGASTATDGHPNDMLDVHSPHGAAHTWKDFWIHLGTISIGLVIAIGLEQSVEAIHRLHERHRLEEDLQLEARKSLILMDIDNQYFDATLPWLIQLRNKVEEMRDSGASTAR